MRGAGAGLTPLFTRGFNQGELLLAGIWDALPCMLGPGWALWSSGEQQPWSGSVCQPRNTGSTSPRAQLSDPGEAAAASSSLPVQGMQQSCL